MYILCQECNTFNAASSTLCRRCGLPLTPGESVTPPTDEALSPATIAPRPAAPPPTPPTPPPKGERPEKSKHTTDLPSPTLKGTSAVGSTIEGLTTRRASEQEVPVALTLYFPRILVAGHPSTLSLQVKSQAAQPMEQIELSFQSRGLINVVTEQLPRLAVEETAKLLVEIEPSSAGEYPLYCALKVRSGEQIKNYLGVRPLRVNAAPDTPATPVNPCDIRTNRGDRQSEFLGSESGPTPFASLLAANPLRNLHDLLNLKLPECYEPVENLVLDSTVPQRVVEDLEAQKSDALLIPRLLLGHVQAGTLLKLTPAYPDTRAVHLVARPQFKVGRKRDEVDLVAWFWPRSMVNDERTRHISKVHVIAECQNGRLFLRDTGSLGGSSFDGKPLAPDKLEPLNRRAALVLASEYYLDVQPMDSYYSGEPVIKNLRAWNGPATGPPPLRRGSLRFAPIGTELAFHDAVWLFSDAAFGTSRANALVLDLAGLAEVQGRFLYYRGCFWLENRVANDAVHINFINLAANEIAPLMTGQFIQLGQINFQVEVLA